MSISRKFLAKWGGSSSTLLPRLFPLKAILHMQMFERATDSSSSSLSSLSLSPLCFPAVLRPPILYKKPHKLDCQAVKRVASTDKHFLYALSALVPSPFPLGVGGTSPDVLRMCNASRAMSQATKEAHFHKEELEGVANQFIASQDVVT